MKTQTQVRTGGPRGCAAIKRPAGGARGGGDNTHRTRGPVPGATTTLGATESNPASPVIAQTGHNTHGPGNGAGASGKTGPAAPS